MQLKEQVSRLLELEMTEDEILTAIRLYMPSEVAKLVVTKEYKICVSRS